MSNIHKIYLIFVAICYFCLKENKIKKLNALVCNVHDKENYVVHIISLKETLNHG